MISTVFVLVGEVEAEAETKRQAQGIPFSQSEIDAIHELARLSSIHIRLEPM